jgi:hypothetical protein
MTGPSVDIVVATYSTTFPEEGIDSALSQN